MHEDGTAQVQRRDRALDGDAFRLDDMGLHARILAARDFAATLRLQTTSAEVSEQAANWAALFDHDEWMLLACVSATSLGAAREEVDRDHDAMPLRNLLQRVLRLCAWLDTWYRLACAIDGPGAQALANGLAQEIVRQLADDMHWLRTSQGGSQWQGEIRGHPPGRLAPIWFSAPTLERSRIGRSAREMLRAFHGSLCDVVARTQVHARELMPASWRSGQHEAAAGLLAGFFSLHESVTQHINGFGARHRDFYFHDVLGLRPKPPIPEQVHLACLPTAQRIRDAQVPAGTRFLAGLDAHGHLRAVQSLEELPLSSARVAKLHSLRLVRGQVALGQADALQRWSGVTRLWADSWDAPPPANAPDGRFRALLGGELAHAQPTHAPARIGLAVVSDLLCAAEGERELCLRLSLSDVEDASSMWRHMTEGDADIQWQFARALNELFEVELTTAAGWWRARDLSLTHLKSPGPEEAEALELRVRLRVDDPAVQAPDPEAAVAPWVGSRPALRMCLRDDAPLCAYTLLASLRVRHVELSLSARGVRQLVLRNQLGRLDPSSPFMPFGPMPKPGDYLSVGAAELRGKPLRALCLHVRWGGLPRGDGGFVTHYAGYDTAFRRRSFTVRTALSKAGSWQVSASEPDGVALFDGAGGEALRALRSISIPSSDLHAQFEPSQGGLGEVGAGVLLLELNEPAAAFGHQEYAQVLTRTVAANARRRRRPLPIPAAPYTPTVQSAWLDYSASVERGMTRVDAAQPPASLDLVQLWPSGWQTMAPQAKGVPLCPQWAADGHLHIGLEDAVPGESLSLLFDLRAQAAQTPPPGSGQTLDAICWEALCAGGWEPLREQDLLSDTTQGMLSPGIVRLVLPQGMVSDSTRMPRGLLWLRLSASAAPFRFAGLYAVHTNGVAARRVFEARDGLAEHRALGAQAVTGPEATVRGLRSVHQVGAAFAYRPPESEAALQVRAAERLRHKARAATPWDFERLLLERFGSVLKAKCFPNLRAVYDAHAPEQVRVQHGPGEVMVAVLPRLIGDEDDRELLGPQFHSAELEEMAEFLRSVSSPFARVTVRNAAYESLQVRASLRWSVRGSIGALRHEVERRLRRGLSPWRDSGRHAHFQWRQECADVEALIRGCPGVEDVSGVSLLRVATSDANLHHLFDTSRPLGALQWAPTPTPTPVGHVEARWPWSVCVALRRHLIETAAAPHSARPSGVGELSLGQTWVIGG